jgi:hypothetical protein
MAGRVLWHVSTSLDGFIAEPDNAMAWAFEHGKPRPIADEIIEATGAILAVAAATTPGRGGDAARAGSTAAAGAGRCSSSCTGHPTPQTMYASPSSRTASKTPSPTHRRPSRQERRSLRREHREAVPATQPARRDRHPPRPRAARRRHPSLGGARWCADPAGTRGPDRNRPDRRSAIPRPGRAMSRVILVLSMSLDGFVAGSNVDVGCVHPHVHGR